jgi:hypothetical protein
MPDQPASHTLVSTVDVRELRTMMWGPLRYMFATFMEEIELSRYLKTVLAQHRCQAVRIEAHRDADGHVSNHVFDIYEIGLPSGAAAAEGRSSIK